MAVIGCENLSFGYRSAGDVLNGVDFSLDSGEIMLVYGESGSGKSTLMRLLKPEISPNGEKSGGIFFGEKPLESLSKEQSAAKIGYVGQNPDAMPVTEYVRSEIMFLPSNLGLPTDEIYRKTAEISAFFGLEPILDRKICELSGGQKQLVNLAAVMVGNPELLLLDEPTAQLDPLAAEQFADTVKRIRSELGTAVIVCEHSTELFFDSCWSLLLLEKDGGSHFFTPAESALEYLGNSPMASGFPCALRLYKSLEKYRDCGKKAVSVSDGISLVRSVFGNCTREDFRKSQDKKSENSDKAVETKRLYFRYDRYGTDIIGGMDFTAYFGEVTAVCGSNGTGKSTLLKLAAGGLKPQEGKILIGGKRISSYKNGSLYRNCLAMLPQNPSDIMIEETVFEDLKKSPSALGEVYSNEEIGSAIEMTGFEKRLLSAHPFDLSGGELQRAALAKLLLTKPKILLLDEPVKGLDPICKRRLSRLLRELADEGRAVIFVTHDLEFAAETADRTVLIFGGRAAAAESTVDFLANNSVYTTAAARIGRRVFPTAVTSERLISVCKSEVKRL
jgi:energy-coupling factor transport system ATP-binding protein